MANWKSPGPDQVQGYWLKQLTRLHERLAQLRSILDDPSCMPSWLTTGRSVLIQKDQTQGNKPSNYRPITCPPTSWKLLLGILADRITQHLNQGHSSIRTEKKLIWVSRYQRPVTDGQGANCRLQTKKNKSGYGMDRLQECI